MSRASRQARRAAAAAKANSTAIASPPQAAASVGFGTPFGYAGYGTNGYQGADWSRHRGFPYFPQLDTRYEITPFTRIETLRRARLLRANNGIVRRILEGAALMVAGSGLGVHPTTSDKEWNRLARDRFNSRAGSKEVFDIGGRFNFFKSQAALLDWSWCDGDAGVALTESQTGQARVAFYEGHQIGTGSVPAGQERLWNDGVRIDPATNRPIGYRLLVGEPLAGASGSDTRPVDIPAQDFIYFGEYENNGQTRCISRLHHALNHLFDRAETNGFLRAAIKLTASQGMAIETETGGASPKSPGMEARYGTQQKVAAFTDANGTQQTVTWEQLYGAGAIARLNPGQKIKLITDDRPHTNVVDFLENTLIREIAWGFGLPPEVIWNIAALGGAGARFILGAAQQWIEPKQQHLIDTYCARTYLYTIAKEMKYGGLRKCQDPQWWKHQWITPPRITVDFGRDGALYLKQLAAGALTYKRLYGWQSLNSEDELNQHLDETQFILAGLKTRGISLQDYLAFRGESAGSARISSNAPEPSAAPE